MATAAGLTAPINCLPQWQQADALRAALPAFSGGAGNANAD
ncbi:hypothetical protein [Bacterioplanoides pacificum]|uniref:Uncharacterized protein n=1 Tax=Bacterioplanoides pacificum TaxID=1171596 RepID=A0ABV7VTX9_9GAMM